MTSRTSAFASDRGAVLVHTAFALLALIAFTTFVVDYGTLWLSRRQAQNSADAGALAGALALAFDAPDVTSDVPKQHAKDIAQSNLVYGQVPDVDFVNHDDVKILCPDCDEQCPNGSENTCVRVDVFRNQERGNPLPVFFGYLVGLNQQGIRATATAEITGANSVRCMLPFALADRWADDYDENVNNAQFAGDGLTGTAGWTPNDHYQGPEGDWYNAPYVDNHTGWTIPGDYGRQVILHAAQNQFSAGWSNIVNLPGSIGNNETRDDIVNCNPTPVAIAEPDEDCDGYTPGGTTPEQALEGCLGVQTGWAEGPVNQGIGDEQGGGPVTPLIEQDDGAVWDWTAEGPQGEQGAVVDENGDLNMDTPRIRPVAVFDITHYMNNSGCPSGGGSGCTVKVVNIVGFFVEGVCSTVKANGQLDPGMDCFEGPGEHPSSQVVGRLVTLPGSLVDAGEAVHESTFIKVVRLIR